MLQFIKNGIKSILLRNGIIVSRTPAQFNLGGFRLRKLRDCGFRCRFAIDGGAATGSWASEFREVFPESRLLLVEPRKDCQHSLTRISNSFENVVVAQTLLGRENCLIDLHVHADQSSILKNSRQLKFGTSQRCPMTTLDALLQRLALPWPDLIKLDLQGAELLCLDGAAQSLAHAEVVMMEVSFFSLYAGSPLIGDVIPYMSDRGFRCYDITALYRRPLDNALAQGDLIFVKTDSPLVADSRWSDTSDWS